MTEKKKPNFVELGRKGGQATGPQKSWVLKLTPEERSAHMRKVSLSKQKHEGN